MTADAESVRLVIEVVGVLALFAGGVRFQEMRGRSTA